MDKVRALLLASWRAARSYRVQLTMSVAALGLSIVPYWYASNAMQPLMADKIRGEGSQYFGFLVVGMMVFSILTVAVNAMPSAISTGISNGSLEALLATKVRAPALLLGLTAFDLSWSLFKGLVVISMGALLGARFAWGNALSAVPIFALIVASYLPFGLLAASCVLAFRTPGPLPQIVQVVSALLGGVYFPTAVIPSLAQHVSAVVPLTYGLRALRSVLLNGSSLAAVGPDLAVLAAMTAGLYALSSLAFMAAMRHVKRGGGLSQY
jgi:ABC-2 type transport system permease protein